MDTPSLTPAAQSTLDRLNRPSTLKNSTQSLGQADFLRLLTTQLTMQDPLAPQDNQAMLAQMAQFSALSAQTASGATLEEISTKLDRLIAAQEASLRPSA
ncbi:flagellar hook assembly protein FlgD [Erythrobacter sp. WG]|uniref:flagellar hook assembly protein FlgD n=1 Tax=Erythrobacter sp. WG TaxID=2985510 RepID=UPI0022711D71|nr:flagellar hook capping FlgD N-terminal domain-containing protein [Erythrobacter sp. WG]MCX9148609.1 flagellar biosynthesis protein FlgD [Erythrobacter sp. WG]